MKKRGHISSELRFLLSYSINSDSRQSLFPFDLRPIFYFTMWHLSQFGFDTLALDNKGKLKC